MKSSPALIVALVMYLLQDFMTSETFVPGTQSKIDYLITQPYVILRYFTLWFAPIDLSADTDWSTLHSFLSDNFILGMVFLFSLVFVALSFCRRAETKLISFGIAWFLIALVPTSSIIPLSEVTNDHRIFFPYVGLSVAVVYWFYLKLKSYQFSEPLSKKQQIVLISFIFPSLLAYGYGTFQRNIVWDSGETLWRDVTEKSPKNGRGHMNYGLALMAKGDYIGAEKSFNQALQLLSCYSYLHINFGVLRTATNLPLKAEKQFKKAIQCDNLNPESHYFYGNFLFKQNRLNEAVPHLEKCTNLSPGHPQSNYTLLKIYHTQKNWKKLKSTCNRILSILPNDKSALFYKTQIGNDTSSLDFAIEKAKKSPSVSNYLDLSLLYYENEEYEKCIESCSTILELDSLNANAYNNMCAAYNKLEMWDKAIKSCEKSLTIKPGSNLARGNLNWANSQKE
ncbi:hypothetical protein N9R81_03945 [Flavobacteriales bacterium]|nr:hypothetical protein [Flavobacteriales bacterium]